MDLAVGLTAMSRPNGMPTTMATTKPHITRAKLR
jgi:hypothetical protein